MDHAEILLALAEVFVAVAGFSGVVAIFGRRDPSTWSFSDRFRFISLIHTSLSSLILCILPFGLFAVRVSDQSVWRTSSSVYVLYISVAGLLTIRHWRTASPSQRSEFTPIVFPVFLVAQTVIASVNIYNAAVAGLFGLFLAALIFLLVLSSFLFARMLVSGFDSGRAA